MRAEVKELIEILGGSVGYTKRETPDNIRDNKCGKRNNATYKGATHLQHIINDKRLVPTDSNKLNLIYNDLDLDKSIIDEDTIRRISKALGISVLEVEMKRARHQILERLQKDNKS
ncbi:11168_t:CDS:2 [Entrophospora sp. SA101]|nr:11168_t:CDS:2 [Entrophospora sp. SA101]